MIGSLLPRITIPHTTTNTYMVKVLDDAVQKFTILNKNPTIQVVYQVVQNADAQVFFPYISSAIEDLVGVSVSQALGDARYLYDLIPDDHWPRMDAAIHASVQDLTPFHLDIPQATRSRGIRWVRFQSTPCRLPNGSIIWHGTQTDITDYKQGLARQYANITRLEALTYDSQSLVGTLTVCAWCRQAIDRDGYWHALEQYFRASTKIDVSHGICPGCAEHLYQEMLD
jgi:hypothetical protein